MHGNFIQTSLLFGLAAVNVNALPGIEPRQIIPAVLEPAISASPLDSSVVSVASSAVDNAYAVATSILSSAVPTASINVGADVTTSLSIPILSLTDDILSATPLASSLSSEVSSAVASKTVPTVNVPTSQPSPSSATDSGTAKSVTLPASTTALRGTGVSSTGYTSKPSASSTIIGTAPSSLASSTFTKHSKATGTGTAYSSSPSTSDTKIYTAYTSVPRLSATTQSDTMLAPSSTFAVASSTSVIATPAAPAATGGNTPVINFNTSAWEQKPCFKSNCNNPNSTFNYQQIMPVSFEGDGKRNSASMGALIFASVGLLLLV